MSKRPGCWKTSLFGCLGLIVLLILFVGITALLARINLSDQRPVDDTIAPQTSAEAAWDGPPLGKPGRLVLDIGQGEFQIMPAEPGAGLSLRARYDAEVHELTDSFVVNPDSSWVYELHFRQTMPGMQALFRALMGGATEAKVEIAIPPESPIELVIDMEEGGFEAEFGGLWLTSADIDWARGGFELDIVEPLREPMESFVIHGRMGGFDARRLGNASPKVLRIDNAMGGASIDLDGAWRNDAAISLKSSMGGVDVRLPDDVVIEGVEGHDQRLRRDEETPLPVLRFDVQYKMGEISIR
ncbi:MAG: hypothetical protein GY838_10705 [bacterium]|nr:hypothetical protein [bacterium]